MTKLNPNQLKKGSLSNKEKEEILSMASTMTAAEIAYKLHRSEHVVADFITAHYVPMQKTDDPQVIKQSIRAELRQSHEWGRLKEEFDDKELLLFEEKYVKLMSQFNNNVEPSEETQIFQSIKLEILMSRNLIARKACLKDAERIERLLGEFLGKFKGDTGAMSDDDRAYALNLEQQLAGLRASETIRTTEYEKLGSAHAKLQKDLKATRDQRIREVEDGKVSYLGLIKMLQQREQAEKEGRTRELLKMAADKELGRLSQYHRYEDGSLDRPILSDETVDGD